MQEFLNFLQSQANYDKKSGLINSHLKERPSSYAFTYIISIHAPLTGSDIEDVVCYLTKNEAVKVFENDCYPDKHFRVNPDLNPMKHYWPLCEEKEKMKREGVFYRLEKSV